MIDFVGSGIDANGCYSEILLNSDWRFGVIDFVRCRINANGCYYSEIMFCCCCKGSSSKDSFYIHQESPNLDEPRNVGYHNKGCTIVNGNYQHDSLQVTSETRLAENSDIPEASEFEIMSGDLASLVGRLEVVASKLESVASKSGSSKSAAAPSAGGAPGTFFMCYCFEKKVVLTTVWTTAHQVLFSCIYIVSKKGCLDNRFGHKVRFSCTIISKQKVVWMYTFLVRIFEMP